MNKFCLRCLYLLLFLFSAIARGDGVFDIEYMPKRGAYEAALGAGLYLFKDRALGYYGAFQVTTADHDPTYGQLNPGSFGDPVVKRTKDVVVGDIGTTIRVTTNFGAYAGVGYASAEGIARKFDSSFILSSNGTYYVKDHQNDKSGADVNAGVMLLLESYA